MKTLKDHIILYDEVCPMCNLYTSGFIKVGMLDKNGREAYQNMPLNCAAKVDSQRAVNEIALVNTQTGEVTYGVKSLFRIIAHSFPVFNKLFNSKAFTWLADKAYKTVSYNRRVIMPISNIEAVPTHQPSFNKLYRTVYLLIAWMITSLILSAYSQHLTVLLPASNWYREAAICGGQILWQTVFIVSIDRKKTWDYLGNMMTISLAGALVLLVVIMIQPALAIENNWVFAGIFMLVAGLMFLEHLRRTQLLQIGLLVSITWVLYRVFILFILF